MPTFFRSSLGLASVCALVATCVLLPALVLQQFALATTALVVLSFTFLLFTRPLYALLAYVMLIPFEELAVFAALGTPICLARMLFFNERILENLVSAILDESIEVDPEGLAAKLMPLSLEQKMAHPSLQTYAAFLCQKISALLKPNHEPFLTRQVA